MRIIVWLLGTEWLSNQYGMATSFANEEMIPIWFGVLVYCFIIDTTHAYGSISKHK